MRAALFACALALSTTACLEETTDQAADPAAAPAAGEEQVAQPAMAGPQAVEGAIDWAAARAAKPASPGDGMVSVQSGEPPQVPVLLPSGIVQAQNARAPALVTTEDGYFATYQTPKYDAIVNGTKKAYATGAAGPAAAKDEMKFTTGEASAQLAFSRFGADYLIEFECRAVDGGDSCITEPEAREFADSLFVSQTQ